MSRIARTVVLFLVTIFLMGHVIGQPLYAAKQEIKVALASKATLEENGLAASIEVKISCPKEHEVLEAFVYITQDGATSNFAGIPLQCTNKKEKYLIRVGAFEESPFHKGEATATAYVLLGDGDLSGGDNRAINIK